MKRTRVMGCAVLFLSLGCTPWMDAQQDGRKGFLDEPSKVEQGRSGVRLQNASGVSVGNPGMETLGLRNLGVGLIPNDRYRAHFGPAHRFHLSPSVYGQDRRFRYGGYSFGFVDEWPTNWLSREQVFVIQIEGEYYLCNSRYPGVTVPVSVAASESRDSSVRSARPRTPKASRAKAGSSPPASAG